MAQMKIPENNLTPQERNELVENNMNLVRHFAYKLCKDSQLLDDCIQEGCLGLMRAARLFDESRHNTFSCFAAFEIQCSIRDFLFRNRMIRLPDDQRTSMNKYQTAVRQMEANNVSITTELLLQTAEEVGLAKDVHNYIINPVSSLNLRISESDNFVEIGDLIPDNINENPVDKMAYEELVSFVRDFFESAKIADEKTRRIVLKQLEQFIKNAIGDNAVSFTELVAQEYPDLDIKSKEFNRHYTRISGVWRNQFNKLKEALSTSAAYI